MDFNPLEGVELHANVHGTKIVVPSGILPVSTVMSANRKIILLKIVRESRAWRRIKIWRMSQIFRESKETLHRPFASRFNS